MQHRTIHITLALTLGVSASGCLDDETFVKNVIPMANAGEDQQLDYDGEPVEVTLDGSGSTDPDGKIVTYRWRSADSGPDGGAPPDSLDPKDIEMPEVILERGTYVFTLWVVDDNHAVSAPDSVTILVGTDAVAECNENVNEKAADSCRECICDVSDECRAAAVACDDTCWDLLICIGDSGCPEGDTACIVGACPDHLGGAGLAMMVGPCITETCGDACASDAAGGADGGT